LLSFTLGFDLVVNIFIYACKLYNFTTYGYKCAPKVVTLEFSTRWFEVSITQFKLSCLPMARNLFDWALHSKISTPIGAYTQVLCISYKFPGSDTTHHITEGALSLAYTYISLTSADLIH
jgi:hypothetical protein